MLGFLDDSLDWRGLSGRGAFALSLAPIAALMILQTVVSPLSYAGAGIAMLTALAVLVFWGQARRRLRDMGWTGWLMWGLVVPGLSLVLAACMMICRSQPQAQPGIYSRTARGMVWVLVGVLASRALWAPYVISTGSMSPTLQPGDYAIATRSYGAPNRGDVVIFQHPATGAAFLKRVIALPGDTVQMNEGRVILNGAPLPQTQVPDWIEPNRATAYGTRPRCLVPVAEGDNCAKGAAIETLPDGRAYTVLDIGPMTTDMTAALDIPHGSVFVLGDNRDNSLDSRIAQSAGGVGLVPLTSISGRVRLVLFSQEGRDGRVLRVVK